jgi:hypothetical protein
LLDEELREKLEAKSEMEMCLITMSGQVEKSRSTRGDGFLPAILVLSGLSVEIAMASQIHFVNSIKLIMELIIASVEKCK